MPIVSGGSGANPLTTKGDLFTFSTAAARLGVGSDTQVLTADSTQTTGIKWATGGAGTTYRKTTAKTVNTTTAATDLLNGEITVAANAIGATGMLRMSAFGDFLQNAGSTVAGPRMQLILGGTTVFDTGVPNNIATSAVRAGWRFFAEILNTATNAQVSYARFDLGAPGSTQDLGTSWTTGSGVEVGSGGTVPGILYGIAFKSSAVDTTASNTLVLNTINGSASATYEMKLYGFLAQVL